MKFEELEIKGAFLIHAEPFEDERGVFRRNFCEKEFAEYGISTNVAQANISENKYTKMEKLNNLAIYKKNEIN